MPLEARRKSFRPNGLSQIQNQKLVRNYLLLKNYDTSEEKVSHNDVYYQQLFFARYQVSFYANNIFWVDSSGAAKIPAWLYNKSKQNNLRILIHTWLCFFTLSSSRCGGFNFPLCSVFRMTNTVALRRAMPASESSPFLVPYWVIHYPPVAVMAASTSRVQLAANAWIVWVVFYASRVWPA